MFWKLIKGKKPRCSQNDFIDKIIDEIGNLRFKNNNMKISSDEKSVILKTLNNSYYNSKNEALLEVIDLLENYRVK